MKVLKLLKVGVIGCFWILFQACPGSDQNSNYKELKQEAQNFDPSYIRFQVKSITPWNQGTKEKWREFFTKIFNKSIDPIIFSKNTLVDQKVAELDVPFEMIEMRRQFLFVYDTVLKAKQLYDSGCKDPDIYRVGVSSKEGYGQVYQEALPLWEFCHAMAQLKEATGLYIFYSSQEGQYKFFGFAKAYSKMIQELISSLHQFFESVDSIKIQSYKPVILPFEELNAVIEEVSQFAQDFYFQLEMIQNKAQSFGKYLEAVKKEKVRGQHYNKGNR